MKHHNKRRMVIGKASIRVLMAVVVIAILLVLGPVAGNVFFDVVREAMATSQGAYSDHAVTNNIALTFTIESPIDPGRTLEVFDEIKEQSFRQEEASREAVTLLGEALEETLEVLAEYADEIGDEELADSLSSLQQEIIAGNFFALEEVFFELSDTLAEVPPEIQIKVIKKILPLMISTCEELSDHGVVSFEIFDEMFQRISQHEAEEPGITGNLEAVSHEAWEIVEIRNSANTQARVVLVQGVEMGAEILETAGEDVPASDGCSN